MGLSSAIDWWDEWKLRVLVLCSLFVYSFLFFSAYVRHWYALRRLRVLVWLAYIGGDALAIYALATLFNRQKQQQTMADGGGGSALDVIWAPVLLIHLGGQNLISAYSLEDNELWKRHAVTLVSQVTVALYVFCKWWAGGETSLLLSTVLLFIVGILKFGQKPWALRRASYGSMSMASTYLSSRQRRRAEAEESSSPWRWCWRRLRKWCVAVAVYTCAHCDDILDEGGVREEGTNYSLEEYVQKAQEHVQKGRKKTDKAQREKFEEDDALVSKDVYKMFLDLSAPYSVRLHYLQSFLNLDRKNQHAVLSEWIHLQFIAIYTKIRSLMTCLGFFSVLVLPIMALASVVLFAKSYKDGYDKSDITVTYILFFVTVVMEFVPISIGLLLTYLCRDRLLSQSPLTWQDMVSQHNVMSFCARKKKPPTLMKLITTFSYLLRDYINKHWYIWHRRVAEHISVLVRRHAEEDGWEEYICDAATYRRFNNLRGERTLMKMSHRLLEQDKLGWTFNLPFDEYILLWHLATDLCIYQTSDDDDASASTSQGSISSRRSSEIISNYMIYLLFICPEMLIPGTRQDLFILACDDIEHIIKNQSLTSLDERSITQWVLRMGQDGDERMKESRMISNAYKLAKALTDLKNNTEMWDMIQGVWVEMLCYSASRCRGYLHAKSLGVAGEFLTNVWLLWWCMGMQTLPDMMNNLGPPEEQTAAAASV